MQNNIIPFENLLLPIVNLSVNIDLPKKPEIFVKKGDSIQVNTILAEFDEEPALETINIDNHCGIRVLQGELVSPGTILAVKKSSPVSKVQTIKSTTYGIVDLKIPSCIVIRQESQRKHVLSGVSGVVESVNYTDYKLIMEVSGAGFIPLYSYNLPSDFSGILDQDMNIRLLTHQGNNGILWDVSLIKNSLIIVDYLTDNDFTFVYKHLSEFKKGLIVLTTEKNKKRTTFILRRLEKIKGRRLFIRDNMIFSSIWKSETISLEYAKLKVGTLVDISYFNKSLISGKITSFKGDYALVETDGGKHRYEHYLNLLKK